MNELAGQFYLSLSHLFFTSRQRQADVSVLIQHNEEQRELIRHITEAIFVYFYYSHAAT